MTQVSERPGIVINNTSAVAVIIHAVLAPFSESAYPKLGIIRVNKDHVNLYFWFNRFSMTYNPIEQYWCILTFKMH